MSDFLTTAQHAYTARNTNSYLFWDEILDAFLAAVCKLDLNLNTFQHQCAPCGPFCIQTACYINQCRDCPAKVHYSEKITSCIRPLLDTRTETFTFFSSFCMFLTHLICEHDIMTLKEYDSRVFSVRVVIAYISSGIITFSLALPFQHLGALVCFPQAHLSKHHHTSAVLSGARSNRQGQTGKNGQTWQSKAGIIGQIQQGQTGHNVQRWQGLQNITAGLM